ncbi:hypothetical protein B0T21DRAFT_414130 [Apiosordaria backusii]|uniref:RRM domain-containing protein n=1 Tax=Apiosordaria backusii TaxID=314023 RepID=A0AA40AXD4_9PEZI|nr:hypothetical protein B0T21DRAFT_414130 [Apiosordaria backusii]
MSATWSEEAVVGDSSPVAPGRARAASLPSSSVASDSGEQSGAQSVSTMESPSGFLAAENKVELALANEGVAPDAPIVSSTNFKKDGEVFETSTQTNASPNGPRSTSWTLSAPVADAATTGPDVDPQEIYPSTACVFVANLAEPRDDVALEAAVTRAFSRFGTVFVKIRRDHNNMPFAFAQYTNEASAKEAIEKGRGMPILGRPCRTEMVKTNRSFIISKHDGSEILIDEARKIMETFGTVSSIEVVGDDLRQRMDLPSAVLVEYSSFSQVNPLNTAATLFPEHVIDMFDVRKRSAISSTDRDADFLRQYDLDRRSVYVGDIPLDATDNEIFEVFSDIGEVIKVNMVKRHTQDGALSRQFCFVEFDRVTTPDEAITALNGTMIRGWRMKVERKQSKVAKTPLAGRYISRSESTENTPTRPYRDAQAAPRPGNFTGQIYNGPSGTLNSLGGFNNSPSAFSQNYQGHQGSQMFQRYQGPAMPPMPYIPGNGTAVGMSGMPVNPMTVSPTFAQSFPVHPPGHTPPGMMSAWPVITNTPTRQHQQAMGPGAQYNAAPNFAPAQMGGPNRMGGGHAGRPHFRRTRARHYFVPADVDIEEE